MPPGEGAALLNRRQLMMTVAPCAFWMILMPEDVVTHVEMGVLPPLHDWEYMEFYLHLNGGLVGRLLTVVD